MALPKLVVFDLDACCWYPEMYMVRQGPPFTKTNEDECKASDGEAIKLLGQTRKVMETSGRIAGSPWPAGATSRTGRGNYSNSLRSMMGGASGRPWTTAASRRFIKETRR